MFIEKGSMFLFTAGTTGSDYEVITFCKATSNIDVIALRVEYLALYPEQEKDYFFKESQFVEWLVVDKKVCEKLDYFEWHLGFYSIVNFSLIKNTPNIASSGQEPTGVSEGRVD